MKFFKKSFINSWPKVIVVFLFIILLIASTNISAVFTPGQTLDPNCAPGTSGCVVSSASSGSQWATSGSDIYFTGGNVGVGTNNPTKSLTVNGGSLFGQGSASYSLGFTTRGSFELTNDGWANDFITSGNYAYTFYAKGEAYYLGILDISDPDNISLVSEISEGLGTNSNYNNHGMAISGNYLYIITSSNSSMGIVIYDISDKNNPLYVKYFDIPISYGWPSPNSVTISGNRLYAIYNNLYNEADDSNYSKLFIYDITDKENPVYVNEIIDYNNEFSLSYTTNDKIYVVSYNSGVYIYNINTLELEGTLEISEISDMVVVGDYAYISTWNNRLFYVVNISNPSNPIVEDSIQTANDQSSVVVSGNYAYVGDAYGGDTLYMFDISDPTDIRQVDYVVNNNIKSIGRLSFSNGNVYAMDWDTNTINAFSVGQKTLYGNSIDSIGGVAIGSYAGVSSASNGGLIISGNVGIGTDNPTSKLSIKLGEGESDALTIFKSSSGSGGGPTLIKSASSDNIYFNLNVDENSMILGGVKYYLPGRATSSDQVLMNDGGGELYWGTPSSDNSSPISAVVTYGLSTSSWGAGSASYSNFLGYFAGYNTNASNSNFLGNSAGYSATYAWDSNFLGNSAGYSATQAYYSNFLGTGAGHSATYAYDSNFIGHSAGYSATQAYSSNFIGASAGSYATNASKSNFFGYMAGDLATKASNSIFIGQQAGYQDTVDNTSNGLSSILIGSFTNTGGYSNSILLGSGVSGSPISNTKANQFMLAPSVTEMNLRGIDYTLPSAQASASGQVLTNDGNGILSWSPAGPISSVSTYGLSTTSLGAGSSNYSNFFGYMAGKFVDSASSSNFLGIAAGYDAANASNSNFLGGSAGNLAANASNSNFLGVNTGYSATEANSSNFLGNSAGYQATNAANSNFLGQQAGNSATNAYYSNFLGSNSGYQATNAYNSNFLGSDSGYQATNASNSNFFGTNAGHFAANASFSNFFGNQAGFSSTNARNSIFIGQQAGYGDTVNNTGNINDFSILIGKDTSTGGFSNSIALGGSATNTATNQFMIGSTTRPINTTVWKGTSATATLDTSTGLITTSDERLKTNIVDLPDDTLSKLVNVRTVTFNWLNGDSDKTNIGFLAQDLQTYFPELVYENADGYFGVNYANMTPVLTEAIKELNLKVKGIGDLTKENDFRDSIIAWFADFNNGITSLFSKEIHTEKICAKRSNGTEYCVNGDDLDRVFGTVSTEINVTSSTPITPVVTNENAPSETGDIPDANQKVPAVVVPETVSSENITTVESGSSIKPESEPEPKPQTPTEVTPVDSSASLQTKPE